MIHLEQEFDVAMDDLAQRFERKLWRRWEQGDAAENLLAHLRTRTEPRLPWTGRDLKAIARLTRQHDPHDYSWQVKAADAALEGKLWACSNPYGDLFTPIDRATFRFTQAPPECEDPQAIHGFNRLRQLPPLVRQYWLTGDRRYFDAALEQWDFFTAVVPEPDESVAAQFHAIGHPTMPKPPYHSLDTFIRLTNFWWTFWLMIPSPLMTGQRCAALLHRALKQFDLVAGRGPDNLQHNFTAMQGESVYLWAVSLPEMPALSVHRHAARNLLESSMRSAIHADGVQWERSASYHTGCVRWYGFPLLLGRMNDEPWAEEYGRRLLEMGRFIDAIITPDGMTPLISDSDREPMWKSALALLRCIFPQQRFAHGVTPTLHSLWCSGGQTWPPDRPAGAKEPVTIFPQGGFGIVRSSSGSEQLIFDNGPTGAGHAHKNNLTVHYEALGQPIVVDAGRWIYDSSDPARMWCVSPCGHNTVVIEDQPIGPDAAAYERDFVPIRDPDDPRLARITGVQRDGLAILRSAFAGFVHDTGARVTRTLVTPTDDRPPFLAIVDRIDAPRPHVWTNIFLLPAAQTCTIDGVRVAAKLSRGAHARIVAGDPTLAVRDDAMFWCPQYGEKSPARWVRFSGSCMSATRAFLIVPAASSPPTAAVSLAGDDLNLSLGDAAWTVRLSSISDM